MPQREKKAWGVYHRFGRGKMRKSFHAGWGSNLIYFVSRRPYPVIRIKNDKKRRMP
jgi:hypothetical protein